MRTFICFLLFFSTSLLLSAQSSQLLPDELIINSATPPGVGDNIRLHTDGSNYLTMRGSDFGSSLITLDKAFDCDFCSAHISFGEFTTPTNTSFARWKVGIGGNIFSESNDFEIVQEGGSQLLLSFISPFSIDAEDFSTTIRNNAAHTLTLEGPGTPASLLIKAFENGGSLASDYTGFQFSPNALGTELALSVQSFDDTGGGAISSTAMMMNFTADGDIEIARNAVFNSLEVGPRFDGLGLDGDVIPFASTTFDLGNNVPLEHWDDVVANEFITYSDARLKHQVRAMEYGLDHILQLNPVRYKYHHDLDEQKDYLGLIAQDVQEIIPEVVASHDTDVDSTGQLVRKKMDYLGINYVALVPVLIHSIQEQQEHIEELEAKNAELLNRLERIEKHLDLAPQESQTIRLSGKAGALGQNAPNPVSEETRITYSLASGKRPAEIRIFDPRGRLLRSISLPQKAGQGEIRLQVHNLPAATYSYSLFVGDKRVDTRSLVVY